MQRSIGDKIIMGSIIVLGLAEVAHLITLFLHRSFSVCAVILAVLLPGAALLGLTKAFFDRKETKSEKGKIPFQTVWNRYWFWIVLIGGLVLFQIIWNYWTHMPYINNDITGETVQTMLATDSIYAVNPLTGQPFSEGMPMRLKVLVLPTLYAVLCKWTGIPAAVMCYRIMPTVILLLSYLVYSRLAIHLFSEDRKKQIWFLFFVALIYQFGCYSEVMDGFLLLFKGGQGDAIRACVLLPYALLGCLQKDIKKIVLCLLAEVCVVWTFYGMGYVALTVGIVYVLRLVKHIADRRKKV